MNFTDQAKNDRKLQARVYKIVAEIKESGIPKTLEGLQEMYLLYNTIYGKNKKLGNCIYCRKSVAEYLEKAVLLLDIKAKKPAPKKASTKPATAPKKAPAKKRTRKRK